MIDHDINVMLQIEVDTLCERIGEMEKHRATLASQRADLLAACEAMVKEIETLFAATAASGMLPGYEAARAAVAKAEHA